MSASPIASRPRLNPGPHPYSLSFVASPTPYISWRVPAVGAGNLRPPIRQKTMKPGPLDRRLCRRKQPRLEKLHFPQRLCLLAHLETPGRSLFLAFSETLAVRPVTRGNGLCPDGLEFGSPRVHYLPTLGFCICSLQSGGRWGSGSEMQRWTHLFLQWETRRARGPEISQPSALASLGTEDP